MTNLTFGLNHQATQEAKLPGLEARLSAKIGAKIGIVGAGLSGTMVAIHLLRQATEPLEIYLIDRHSTWGQGVAYRTEQTCHLLNVPVSKMSLFSDQPNHFLHWLDQHSPIHANHAVFVPRSIYGKYIQSVLQDTVRSSCARLHCCIDNVISIKSHQTQLELGLQSDELLRVDRAVLAVGNFPPRHPVIADSDFYQSDRYVHSVWADDRLTRLPTAAPVLLIGSGLTAIDQVMTLHQQGHQGQTHLVSRRGLLPQAHQSVRSYPLDLSKLQSPSLRSLMRSLRQEVNWAVAQGYDWRSVMDALRPQTQTLWQSLTLTEQRRFLCHARPYWEIHRHRIAPAIAQILADLLQTGQLQIHAGKIQSFEQDANGVTVTICNRKTQDLIQVRSSLVANCTGSECDYRQLESPLIQQLLTAGWVQPDPLALGLAVAEKGALINSNGIASHQLYTLGSPQKGKLWETTAVPEIRLQAANLARSLLKVPVK